MINTVVPSVSPYPGLAISRQESTPVRAGESEENHNKNNELNVNTVNRVGNLSDPRQHTNQRFVGRGRHEGHEDELVSFKTQTMSASEILGQLINEMGGSGIPTGPGRFFDLHV